MTGPDVTPAGLPPRPGPVRPRPRARCLRRRLRVDIKGRRSHAIVSQALRCSRTSSIEAPAAARSYRGRRRHHHPDAAYVPAARVREPGHPASRPGHYGAGLVFLPRDAAQAAACERILEDMIREEGQTVLGWRDVPTDSSAVGPSARAVEPRFRQVFVGRAEEVDRASFERKLLSSASARSTRWDAAGSRSGSSSTSRASRPIPSSTRACSAGPDRGCSRT